MYLTLIALVVGLVTGIGTWYLGAGWFGGLLLGLLGFVLSWIVGGRRLRKKIEPAMAAVQRQIEAGMAQPAIATLRTLLPLGDWVPLLKGSIYAQIGLLAFHTGKRDEAIDALTKAGRRSGEAQLLLASIRYRDGKKDEAFAILSRSAPFNRKQVLFHNVWAWLLNKEGNRAEAIQILDRHIRKQATEASSDNMLRLQNDQKMNMKSFGLQWYALGFERPPASMGEMRQGRKGFRTPPKQRGKS